MDNDQVRLRIRKNMEAMVEMTATAFQNRRGKPLKTPAGVTASITYARDDSLVGFRLNPDDRPGEFLDWYIYQNQARRGETQTAFLTPQRKFLRGFRAPEDRTFREVSKEAALLLIRFYNGGEAFYRHTCKFDVDLCSGQLLDCLQTTDDAPALDCDVGLVNTCPRIPPVRRVQNQPFAKRGSSGRFSF